MPEARTRTIAEAEYQALRKLYDECVSMRDAKRDDPHPLRDWNRMSPGVRLSVVELEALYRDRGDLASAGQTLERERRRAG